MVDVNKTFCDKKCDVYRTTVVDKDWTQVPESVAIYENLDCDYYIAPRWNVINYLPNVEARNTERDRFDCVVAGVDYDVNNPIRKGDTVRLYSEEAVEWDYVVDQLSVMRFPNGKIDNVYLRLNNDSKWGSH
jgi:hypothetical protein